MNKHLGRASVQLNRNVYVIGSASVVGSKEAEGPLGLLFDCVGEDNLFGCDSFEDAESKLQQLALELLLQKTGIAASKIDLMLGGDLLGQSIATSFGIASYKIPFCGLYGACSTCGEAFVLASLAISSGAIEKAVCVTSSHFASAEREFRFPLDYGNQRPLSATWTVTGSGAFLLSNALPGNSTANGSESSEAAKGRITGLTIGQITDYGLKDSMNMGACMAPAAASTIEQHFKDFGRTAEDYDKIITGDLGYVGQRILIELLRERGIDISEQHMDCGIEIYDADTQDTHAGGSGCGCSAVTLSSYILKQLSEKNWKRVLFLPTGALLSKISYNEGKSVPGIAHAIVLESCL